MKTREQLLAMADATLECIRGDAPSDEVLAQSNLAMALVMLARELREGGEAKPRTALNDETIIVERRVSDGTDGHAFGEVYEVRRVIPHE